MNFLDEIPDAAKNWTIVTILGALLSWFVGICKRQAALRAGMKVLLQSEIKRECKEYRHQKEISEDDMDDLTDKYKVYKTLGGNGTVEKLYKEVYALPTSDKE